MKFSLIAEVGIFLGVFVKRGVLTPMEYVFPVAASGPDLLSKMGGGSVEVAGGESDSGLSVRFFSCSQFAALRRCRLSALLSKIGCDCCRMFAGGNVYGLITAPIRFHETIEVR